MYITETARKTVLNVAQICYKKYIKKKLLKRHLTRIIYIILSEFYSSYYENV